MIGRAVTKGIHITLHHFRVLAGVAGAYGPCASRYARFAAGAYGLRNISFSLLFASEAGKRRENIGF